MPKDNSTEDISVLDYNKRAQNLMKQKSLSLGSIFDRTGTINVGFANYPNKVPSMPDYSNSSSWSNYSLSSLMDRVQDKIWKGNDNIISVAYSGGIDSVAVAVAFLKNHTAEELKQRFHLVLTKDSIIENPNFWKFIVADKINYTFVRSIYNYAPKDDEVIVTGELGDQIFGMGKGNKYRDGYEDFPYEDYSKGVVEYIQPLLDKSPHGGKKVLDVMWWLRFCLQFTAVVNRISNISKISLDKYVHFFEDDLFQKWSILNHDKKIKNLKNLQSCWASYKYPLKQYIYEFNNDEEYFLYKVKELSLVRNKSSIGATSHHKEERKVLL